MAYSEAQGKDPGATPPRTIYRNFPGPAIVGRRETTTGDATPLKASSFWFTLLQLADAAAWRNALEVISGVDNFLALVDTPSSYSGQASKAVAVNAGETALEFITFPAGYTDEQARDAVGAMIQNGTGISWSYNDPADTLTPTVTLAPFSTTNLAEGVNLYFTDERVDDRVAALLTAGTNITLTYDDAANTLTIDASGSSGLTHPQVMARVSLGT